MLAMQRPDAAARRIAWTAGGAFAAFYTFYAAAPLAFDESQPDGSARIAILMAIVVAVQPLVPMADRWVTSRGASVGTALALMGIGSAIMPLFAHWPGQVLLGIGFGIYVVASTAWVKESTPSSGVASALGLYGFAAAAGGAMGAPLGLSLVQQFGVGGIAATGAMLAFSAAVAIVPDFGLENFASCAGATFDGSSRRADRSSATGTVAESYAAASTRSRPIAKVDSWSSYLGLIAAQLLVVALYATVLLGISSPSNLSQRESMWLAVAMVFAIQVSLATGRMIGGVIAGRWTPSRIGLPALGVAVLASAIFVASDSPTLMMTSAALVGLSSGACQTAVLTSLMRLARSRRGVTQASAAWNMCFDLGLGIGALMVASVMR